MALPADNAEESARFKRTLRAAEELFKRMGFRAVTMELVAREANVAKATLYSYFRNKDELYIAVCVRLAALLQGAVDRALTLAATALDARLTEAIVAKQRVLFGLLRRSPHAAQLFADTQGMASHIFGDLDVTILRHLEAALRSDPDLAPAAPMLARALYFGSAPLAVRAQTEDELDSVLRAFCTTHLAGARSLSLHLVK